MNLTAHFFLFPEQINRKEERDYAGYNEKILILQFQVT